MPRSRARKVAEQWLRDILEVLYQRRALTRYEINDLTGLNAGSASLALASLLETGVILKVGESDGENGRKRDVFSLNPEAGFFVAIDLEGRALRFALTNLLGDVRYRWDQDLEYGQPAEIRTICDGTAKVLSTVEPRQSSRVLAIGVSYPGLLDENGCLSSVNLGWHKIPLARELERAVKLPVFLEHDVRSCLMAERWLGRAQNYSNALFVLVERGVGLGILLDGKPVEGWRHLAGEIGHLPVNFPADDECSCGRRGCVESIASSGNIIRQYLWQAGRSPDEAPALRVTHIFERARGGDPAAVSAIQRAARALGLGVANAVALLNPQIVVFGGEILAGTDVFLPLVREEIARWILPQLAESLEIVESSLGSDIRLKGAASLAFRASVADSGILNTLCGQALAARA